MTYRPLRCKTQVHRPSNQARLSLEYSHVNKSPIFQLVQVFGLEVMNEEWSIALIAHHFALIAVP
jgi:hypothetical protein